MARFAFCYAVILGMLLVEAMAAGSADLEAYPRKLMVNRSLLSAQQSRTEGSVADPPIPGGQDSSSEGKGEAGAPESVETAEHHHSDKSVAGGGVIIGGLVTAIFAAVYCYIRVTRKRVDVFFDLGNEKNSKMDRHIQIFLNKISFVCFTIATLILLLLYLRTPDTCVYITDGRLKADQRFPRSTCDFHPRAYTSVDKRNRRIWATKAWTQIVRSYTDLFQLLRDKHLFSVNSRALVVSAGGGHAVMALKDLGLSDVTGIEVVDSPPLVSKADPHNLPFFDNAFDFGFSPYLDRALFPARYVEEMERVVRGGGACVVAVEECGDAEMEAVVKLFRKSKFLGAMNVSLGEERKTRIVLRVKNG
nr:uncharacterized protein LOC109155742 [Ipomoea batatas]